MTDREYDYLIVGGGFFGLNIAEYFAKEGKKVLLCERAERCMTRASYNNQARVHNGYHYPRSLLTAMRSRVSFPRFERDFPECVKDDIAKYYAIGKILGKVTAKQFFEFCRRVGAPCEEAEPAIAKMFCPHYIEQVFRVKEHVFNSTILCETMLGRLAKAGAELRTSTEVVKLVSREGAFRFEAQLKGASGESTVLARHVFNCTYANLNFISANSGYELIPLKYEMTEMALVKVPDELKGMGITVMCGPFFSLMPFPSKGDLYTLSHVRYTPHYEWHDRKDDGVNGKYVSPLAVYDRDAKKTCYPEMVRDSARYLPAIAKCEYAGDSIWELKTLLPSSEVDDSRPILFKPDYGVKGFHCVMGGKIDNVYDVISAIEQEKERFQ